MRETTAYPVAIGLALLLAVALWPYPSKADVTGSLGIRVLLNAVPCELLDDLGISGMPGEPCEKTFFQFEFESELSLHATISGLTLGLHSHVGTTGFEDILITFDTTLGALDITDTFVFAQPYGITPPALDNDGDGKTNEDPFDGIDNDGDGVIDEDPVEPSSLPVCYEDAPGSGVCLTLFVKKRVEASVTAGGLTFRNLAIIEDVHFPQPFGVKPIDAIYTQQSQAFGFGDLITILGQTPSGVTFTGQTSFCISETGSNLIKKHSFAFTVNPDCVGDSATVKPSAFFDFERISITSIPVTSNLRTDLVFHCSGIITCTFTETFTLSGAPLFSLIKSDFSFSNVLGPFSFSNVTLRMQGSMITLTLIFDPASAAVTSVSAAGTFTLNPDTNPASLSISVSGRPGTGLNSLVANLNISRSGMTVFALATFSGSGGALNFSSLTLRAATEASVFHLEGSTSFRLSGFAGASLRSSVSF